MPLFKYRTESGYVIESEPKDYTLRIEDDIGNRLGSVEVQAASLSLARVTNLNLSNSIRLSSVLFTDLKNWLVFHAGFTEMVWERRLSDGRFRLVHSVFNDKGERIQSHSKTVSVKGLQRYVE